MVAIETDDQRRTIIRGLSAELEVDFQESEDEMDILEPALKSGYCVVSWILGVSQPRRGWRYKGSSKETTATQPRRQGSLGVPRDLGLRFAWLR